MGYPDWQSYQALAQLISAALSAAGIPIAGNPVPRYDVVTPAPSGVPGPWGATVFGGGGSEQTDIGIFTGWVNRPVAANRVYYNDNGTAETYTNSGQFDNALAAAYNLGLVAVISYKPTFSGTTGPDNLPSPDRMQADQTAMVNSLNSVIAAGFPAANLRVAIWHEANYQPHGISAAQYHNLYSGVASGGKSNYAALHAICPVYSIMLGNQPPTSQQIITYPPVTPTLPANACDALLVDWYIKPYLNQQWLGGAVPAGQNTWDSVARAAGIPLGIGEYGGLSSAAVSDAVKYLLSESVTISGTTYPGDGAHSMGAVMGKRLSDGLTNAEVIIFLNLSNNPTLPSWAPAVLRQLYRELQTVSASNINPGSKKVLTPLAPSPVAGYASADGIGYDITISLISASAASTRPFADVEVDWYNIDDPAALPAASQRWSMPIGADGTAGTVITGAGPQAGRYFAVSVINHDTVGVGASVQVNGTGRTQPRHDWRWDADDSVAVPGYTLPAGQKFGLSLGAVNGFNLAVGASQSWLVSMFAGQAALRVVVTGAAGTKTVLVQLAPQPGNVWTGTHTFSESLPLSAAAGDNDVEWTATLGRAPYLLTVTNQDANPVVVSWELTAVEP